MVKNCCKTPFLSFTCEVTGDCYACCSMFQLKKIGNIYENTFDEIWYGKEAVEFRQSVLDGSYSLCNFDFCNAKFLDDVDGDFVALKPPYPKFVTLSYVMACNVRCITCRDKVFYESKENTEVFDRVSEKLIPVLKTAEILTFNGGGELFVSNHFRKFIPRISGLNPTVKYNIISNGILCDEEHCREFGIIDKMNEVAISLHSATKKTYDKIVRGGNFDRVVKNLFWLSGLKKSGKLNKIVINFVIHSLNYHEMVKCVKLAEKLDATVMFWRVRNWKSSEFHNSFDSYAVWRKSHKKYKKFLKELWKLKKYRHYILSDPVLVKLQKMCKKNWLFREIDWIKGVCDGAK